MLCVKNVSLRLPESRLLTNVNFTVDKGDIVTLMGPSGCGKSTLFSWMIGALAGQFSCTGELWLNEQRIDMLPTAQRQIGILFQDALLFVPVQRRAKFTAGATVDAQGDCQAQCRERRA